jgi:hypothetical protein
LPSFIDGAHDFFGPAHRVRNGAYGCGNPFAAVILCSAAARRGLPSYQQNALAGFIHGHIIGEQIANNKGT